MERILTVRSTMLHKAGKKYQEMLESGMKIAAPVVLKEKEGRVEAYIDDEAIGFVLDFEPDEIPNFYDAALSGLGGPQELKVILTASEAAAPEGDYAEEKKRLVSEGIFTEEEVDERIAYMEKNRVHHSVILAVLESITEKYEDRYEPNGRPLYMDARQPNQESIMNQLLIMGLNNMVAITYGEKSTGKNVAADSVAYVRGLPKFRKGFQRDMLLEDVIGGKETDNTASNKLNLDLAKAKLKVEFFKETATPKDIEKAAEFDLLSAQSASIKIVQSASDIIMWAKSGGVMIFDEVNMANANLLQALLNPIADGDKVLVIPGIGTIKLHKNCVLIAGMNPGYAGTMELNNATKSRCGFIEFELPRSIKEQLSANFNGKTKLTAKYFNACDTLYKDFRSAVSQSRISNDCLNIRGFVAALKAIERFPEATTLATQLEAFVINGCSTDERPVLTAMLHDKIAL